MKTRKNSQSLRVVFAAIYITAIFISNARGVSYTAIDLHPGGIFNESYAYKVSGVQQAGYSQTPWGVTHAFLWNSSSTDCVDLNPSEVLYSIAKGISGTQQVGQGRGPATGGNQHALLWNGTAASYVDLNPSAFSSSGAYGTNGTQQFGYGSGPITSYRTHALLWSGTAESFIDLHPSGFDSSYPQAINDTHQVGFGFITLSTHHALLWNGTAESCIDLNPSGFLGSWACDVNGIQQVGSGYISITAPDHALLWTGTAESCVDLHPSEFYATSAYGTNGKKQVGYGKALGRYEHALLWNGAADDYIDLHQFLPPGFILSRAYGIDSYGNIVGWAENSSKEKHAILWRPVSESVEVAVDIKPGGCPNPFNVKSKGVLPVAVLGTSDFDVTAIDTASIRLVGVAPIRFAYEDVAAPVSNANGCDCTTAGPDGLLDLTLKFDTQSIVEAIGDVSEGELIMLELTGVLFDESAIEGTDCVLIVGGQKP